MKAEDNTAEEDTAAMQEQTIGAIRELQTLQKRFEKSISDTHHAFTHVAHDSDTKQALLTRKVRRAERTGLRILMHSSDFVQHSHRMRDIALELYQARSLHRPEELQEHKSCFSIDDPRPASSATGGGEGTVPPPRRGTSLRRDIRHMRSVAAKRIFERRMNRVVQQRWLVTAVVKVRDHLKRMNNQAPLCCLRIIVILQHIVMEGFHFTQDIFYRLMEEVILDPEDHLKGIVHSLVTILREALDIEPSEFLTYLETKEIQPNPELMNQVRSFSKPGYRKTFNVSSKRSTVTLSVRSPSANATAMSSSKSSKSSKGPTSPAAAAAAGSPRAGLLVSIEESDQANQS
mmetsp:Transcript_18837/g.31760  ORF Transcript_18837/g.31760 Transcript_18837/m.31760 type:complete len:346 (-) Transcript_18837:428-1465(-)